MVESYRTSGRSGSVSAAAGRRRRRICRPTRTPPTSSRSAPKPIRPLAMAPTGRADGWGVTVRPGTDGTADGDARTAAESVGDAEGEGEADAGFATMTV